MPYTDQPVYANYRLVVIGRDAGTYNLTSDMLTADTWRGRDFASMLTGRSSAGTLDVKLKNLRGQYSSGELDFGKGSPAILYMTYGVTERAIWGGYVDSLDLSSDLHGMPTADLKANGILSKLVGRNFAPDASDGDYAGNLIRRVLTSVGLIAFATTVDRGDTFTSPWYVSENVDPIEAIRQLEDTDQGFFYENKDGYMVYEGRHYRMVTDRCTIPQSYFVDIDGGYLSYRDITRDNPSKMMYNRVVAQVTPYVTQPQDVLWTLGDVPTVMPAATDAFPGVSQRQWIAPKPSDSVYVKSWVIPDATDITADVPISSLYISGGGSAPMTFTIGISHTLKQDVTISSLRARGVAVTASDKIQVTRDNLTSQSKYGQIKEFAYPGPWLPSVTVAESYSNYIAARYGDPLPVIRLTFLLNRNVHQMQAGFLRELSDRVHVIAQSPTTRLNLNGDYFVEAISHSIKSQFEHEVTFDLSPVSPYVGYWRIGTSKLNTETRVAF